ncbi:hypothetical protein [Phytohabitans rumicis]|uniref:hypothetical protein n=1 Tax=Phytohabitans rumicis TaxID=1076125 RepID=UPI00156322DE|nr:hypothetical protein [Phytohabitans rumicis]
MSAGPYSPVAVLAEIAFCFRCRNAKVLWPDGSRRPTWFTVDPDSKPAQDLLQRLDAAAGEDRDAS